MRGIGDGACHDIAWLTKPIGGVSLNNSGIQRAYSSYLFPIYFLKHHYHVPTAKPPLTEYQIIFLNTIIGRAEISVYRVPTKSGVTHAVDLYDPTHKFKVTLADVLELYGLPCQVTSDYEGSIWFAYPNMLVHALLDNEPAYSHSAPINYLHLLDPDLPISISGITVCDGVEYTKEYRLWFTGSTSS
jgi:hypothetical protein